MEKEQNRTHKIIGIDLFHKGDLYEKDFKSEYDISYFFYNLSIGEYCMSKYAYRFFEEKFGIEKIAKIILESTKEGTNFPFKNKDDIIKWIKEEGIEKPKIRNELNLE